LGAPGKLKELLEMFRILQEPIRSKCTIVDVYLMLCNVTNYNREEPLFTVFECQRHEDRSPRRVGQHSGSQQALALPRGRWRSRAAPSWRSRRLYEDIVNRTDRAP